MLLTLVCRETLLMNRKVRAIYWSRSWPLTPIVRAHTKASGKLPIYYTFEKKKERRVGVMKGKERRGREREGGETSHFRRLDRKNLHLHPVVLPRSLWKKQRRK